MILALETSAEPASISLYCPVEAEITSRAFPNKNQVNVPLAEELQILLEEKSPTIELVLVGAGPGSYSGARVGLATAEALSMTHNCPVVTLPSYYGLPADSDKPYALLGDARRGAYFIQSPQSHSSALELQLYEAEAFPDAVANLTETHDLYTFESPDKLSLSASVIQASSTSESLIRYWNSLLKEEQEYRKDLPKEVLYLRPPNITKAKNPFL